MNICKLNMLEYYIAFAGHHTALSNHYAAQADACSGLFCARIDGAYAGFLCVLDETDYFRISYAMTVPQYRNRGVFTGLLQYIISRSNRPLRITMSSGHAFYESLRSIVEKLGFTALEKVHVFSCVREDKDKWDAFMEEKGERLCNTLRRAGYQEVCFQEMNQDLRNQLRLSDKSDFGNMFHPAAYLDDDTKKLSYDLSFSAVRDGNLAAYCLVAMGDQKSAMFEQISVSKKEQGRGVILLPYASSVKRFFDHDLEQAFYAMYDSNRHANAFRKRILQIFPTKECVLENYCYMKQGR